MRFAIVLSAPLLAACIPIPVSIDLGTPAQSGPVTPWPATAHCPMPERGPRDAARLQGLINAQRAKAGLRPVALSPDLSEVSRKHACDNAARQATGHKGSDGATLADRLRRKGIAFRQAAENTGLGFTSPEAAMACSTRACAWAAFSAYRLFPWASIATTAGPSSLTLIFDNR